MIRVLGLDLPLPLRRAVVYRSARRQVSLPIVPLHDASARSGWLVGVGCVLLLVGLFVADLRTPATVTTGALAVLPVGVAAWVLSRQALLGVLAVGILAQVVVAANGSISVPTAAAAVLTLVVVALVARFAAESHATVLKMRGELQRLAIERDRARIRQDLHDGAVQTILAVGMALDSLADGVASAEVSERIRLEAQTLDLVVEDVRSYVHQLVPLGAAEPDLSAALGTLRSRFELATGLRCDLEIDAAASRVSAPVARELVKVVNEALSNAVRHGGATKARVALEVSESVASVRVSDNGTGFDVATAALGDGIRGFALRAGAIGGDIQVESTVGAGSSVQVRMPLMPAAPTFG